jgi:Fe-S cluster assembly ATPase SufC
VLSAGRIVKEGGKELALELEEKGYDWLKSESGRKLNNLLSEGNGSRAQSAK